jgi:hypothetical protein
MTAASLAHKPPSSKSPEQVKTSPTYALRAASIADRDSAIGKTPLVTSLSTPNEPARIQKHANELTKRDLPRKPATGVVNRSDVTRVANLRIATKRTSDQAEQEKANARRQQIEGKAPAQHINQQDLDGAAGRIVAERFERVTSTKEEDNEILAGRAADESIHRGNERVRDWERALKSLESKSRPDKEKKTVWLRQSMRPSAHAEPGKHSEVEKFRVQSQLGTVDKSIAHKHVLLRRPTGEPSTKQDAVTKEIKQEGGEELPRTLEEGAILFLRL